MAAQPTAGPIIIPGPGMERVPSRPLGNLEGVEHRILWHDDTSMAGVLTIDAGQHLGSHSHRRHHHHLWFVDGEAEVFGQMLGPGSYVHIPDGVEHDIDASETDGCTVFYLYLDL